MKQAERQCVVFSNSAEETFHFGVFLGQKLDGPLVITLTGELGSGKTCLAQGIARGLGIPEQYYVTSPSFALVNEYPGRLHLYHIDLYRVEDMSELDEIGLDEILTSDAISVIEWPERLGRNLPKERLDVFIRIIDDLRRSFRLVPKGHQALQLVQACLHQQSLPPQRPGSVPL
jgi:tRNA threonylcarbamoyladenosine biosynthesis protein TsaE